MKHSLVVFSLFISSISFAGTIGNGVTLSNLPTASKSYVEYALSADDQMAKDTVVTKCKYDKVETERAIAKLGAKIITSEGCTPRVSGGFYDQGGSEYKVETEFEVVFK